MSAHLTKGWHVIDTRTGRPASIAWFATRARAEQAIEGWRTRQATGGRRDLTKADTDALEAVPCPFPPRR